MIIALVRHIETHHFVGLFAAPDLPAMQSQVRECYQLHDCEFAQIQSAGFFCGNPALHDVRLPLREKKIYQRPFMEADWQHSAEVFHAAEPTEALAAAMSDPELAWQEMEGLTDRPG